MLFPHQPERRDPLRFAWPAFDFYVITLLLIPNFAQSLSELGILSRNIPTALLCQLLLHMREIVEFNSLSVIHQDIVDSLTGEP